jgi:hypothetical protein
MKYFKQLCAHWCSLLPKSCSGVLYSGPDGSADPPRYQERCTLVTEQCVAVDQNSWYQQSKDFGYMTISDMQNDPSKLMQGCAVATEGRGTPRLLLVDEVLFDSEEEIEEFEADVALEGMDVPVADT